MLSSEDAAELLLELDSSSPPRLLQPSGASPPVLLEEAERARAFSLPAMAMTPRRQQSDAARSPSSEAEAPLISALGLADALKVDLLRNNSGGGSRIQRRHGSNGGSGSRSGSGGGGSTSRRIERLYARRQSAEDSLTAKVVEAEEGCPAAAMVMGGKRRSHGADLGDMMLDQPPLPPRKHSRR